MFGVGILPVVLTAAATFLVSPVQSAACSSVAPPENVSTSDDVQSLRDALNCTGQRSLSVTWRGAIQIDERIVVSTGKSLTVSGANGDDQDEIDAGHNDGIFLVSDQSMLTLKYLTLRDGNASSSGGAIAITNASTVVVEDCNFTGNSAEGSGGAISVASSSLTLAGYNTFVKNTAELNGGVIAASDGSEMNIDSIYAFKNSARQRGGAFNVLASSMNITGDADIQRHEAGLTGGVINANEAFITFQSTAVVSWNFAQDGGAIYANGTTININGLSMFEGNYATLDGGAINEEDCVVRIRHKTNFTSNWARNGGAIRSSGGSEVYFTGNVSFTNNSAVAGGGAMLIAAPDTLDLSDSRFNLNVAEFGGAISLTSTEDDTKDFANCYFEENQATDGGALYLYTGAGTAAVKNSVFYNNYARISGGAIFHTGSMSLDRCAFIENEAGDEGLAVISIGLLVSMDNVTFQDNTKHCDTGEYGYMNNSFNQSYERFDMACARCSTGSSILATSAVVTDELHVPVCTDLPYGARENETGITLETIILNVGYYRISNTSTDVRECYQKEACIGGYVVGGYCAAGYQGPYCAVCKANYTQGMSYTCTECSSGSERSAVALAVFIGIAAVVATTVLLSYLGKGTDEWEEENMAGRSRWDRLSMGCHDFLLKVFPLTAIKIVVVVWQIVSQFAAIAGNVYPQEYEDFLSSVNPINFDIGLFSSFSCMMTTDFYDRLLLATLAPIAVLGLLVVTYVIAKIRNRASELAVRRVQHKHLSAALFVAFFVYSSVSYTVFQTFVCDRMDDGEEYLRAAYDLTCTTDRHKKFRLYAKFMVCIYPVGIPAVFTFWLARNRKDLVKPGRDDMLHLQPASDIWAAYKPSRYYYEVVECARRITLTGIAVFVLPNSPAQIAVVLLLAVVFLFVSESMSPFEKGVDMGLYRWGNGIILASMYVALLLKVDVSNEESGTLSAFAGVLIAANVCMILTVMVQSALLVKDWIVARRRGSLVITEGVPKNIPVFLLNVRSADEADEQVPAWSTEVGGYNAVIKRASVVPEPHNSPKRPAPFEKQSCFRSSSQDKR